MNYHVTHRYGAMTKNPPISSFSDLLRELVNRPDDQEHSSVSVTHESEWCLSASVGGCLTFENLEHGEARHMNGVSSEKILELWEKLACGDLARIEQEPWRSGSG